MTLDFCYSGDCRDSMRQMIADGVRVQMCVTSPPYFGLRDYGHAGQLGLEKTPAEYVAAMVEVFALVRELLADDGVLWLNLGDSYARTGGTDRKTPKTAQVGSTRNTLEQMGDRTTNAASYGLKAKDLIGIPWRVAFALQADGWYLRQDIIWHKPNPMPESVADRCTKAHEYLFLLSKSERYYWDAEAMRERAVAADIGAMDGGAQRQSDGTAANAGRNFRLAGNVHPPKGQAAYEAGDNRHRTKAGLLAYAQRQRSKRDSLKRENSKRAQAIPGQAVGTHRAEREESTYETFTRNRRSVWTVPTVPYSGAHFATFPPALVEPCILAGSRPGDTVFDPFLGSGTVAQVAQNLGRHWLGCELNPEYERLQKQRTLQPGFIFDGDQP